VKYDTCFHETNSIATVLEKLYSAFQVSDFKTFNFEFMQGQCDHFLQRVREEQERIKVEKQEREARAIEAGRLELEKQKHKEEEEIAKRQRRDELYQKGNRAIENGFVGEVSKFIQEAKDVKFEDLFQVRRQDAES
jgi:hypothetical protein